MYGRALDTWHLWPACALGFKVVNPGNGGPSCLSGVLRATYKVGGVSMNPIESPIPGPGNHLQSGCQVHEPRGRSFSGALMTWPRF